MFLLQVHQHSPGIGFKISERKPGVMAHTSRIILNPVRLGGTIHSLPRKEKHLNSTSQREVVPPSQGVHIALSFTANVALIPGLDCFPAPWAAELSQAAPTPLILHANEPQPRGKASPHQHQQLGIPANTCPLVAALATGQRSHQHHHKPTTTSDKHHQSWAVSQAQRVKINPWRYFRAQRNHS